MKKDDMHEVVAQVVYTFSRKGKKEKKKKLSRIMKRRKNSSE